MDTPTIPEFRPLADALTRALAEGRLDQAALATLLARARAAPLALYPAVARALRAVAWGLSHVPVAPSGVPLVGLIAPVPDLAWLTLHSPNGFHRDAALRALPAPAHALDLAALVSRLDDWVPEVSALAEARLAQHAPQIPAAVIADVMLARMRRVEGGVRMSNDGYRRWLALIDREDVRAELVQRLRREQGASVRWVFLRVMEDPRYDPALPMLLREAAHPSIRAAALWWLVSGQVSFIGWGRQWVPGRGLQQVQRRRPLSLSVDPAASIEAAATDRSSPVRKVAAEMLRAYAANHPQAARALALRLAADRNRGVRERADWFLTPRPVSIAAGKGGAA